MPRIDIAEQAGVGVHGRPRPTEDKVVTTGNAVVLLDGATEFRDDLPSGGWYAARLAEQLDVRLRERPDDDLSALLADAITGVTTEHDLRPGHSPSSTVAMLRWTEHRIDTLVLADSPVVVFHRSGRMDVLADDRLLALRKGGALRTRADVSRLRNAEGGFWVAEADPAAAGHALHRSLPRADVDAVLLATDGVAIGVDEYRILGWPDVLCLAREKGAAAVLDTVRAAEHDDPDGARWPRSKRHDDQAFALIDFTRK
ncbi:protein phosphatase 2C domain-containing protein [Qaidamihabitans albus]|uniref:protein phosphatase 2C domain-containing protein n=1 Tax=Qaidamihabitans albus TaxID=2795733 RepID=UPI0018F1E040|nr:protein phosphatase 2C domain-containing protein [Qaidamihabitans albus]